MDSIIQTITVYAIPVLLAITLHEAAHAYVAKYFGDNTSYMMGRVTLNPAKHIDPIGTIAVPILFLITTKMAMGAGMLFGWAKPVPVMTRNLRNPKKDMIWIAAAGPGANLVMAIGWAILLKVLGTMDVSERFFIEIAIAGITVNIGLMALNLLPLPPLDGGRIVYGLLPHGPAEQYAKIEPYGMWILIVLLVTGTLSFFVRPFLQLGYTIIGFLL